MLLCRTMVCINRFAAVAAFASIAACASPAQAPGADTSMDAAVAAIPDSGGSWVDARADDLDTSGPDPSELPLADVPPDTGTDMDGGSESGEGVPDTPAVEPFVDTTLSPDGIADLGDIAAPDPTDANPGTDGADTSPIPETLAVLSLNLHCLKTEGTVYADNAGRMAAIATLVDAESVDVLLLQEACEAPEVSALALLEAALEAKTGDDWTAIWRHAHVAWEGTPDEADEGLGLLARVPLQNTDTLVYAVQGGLRRVALSATVATALGALRVTSVHLDFDSADTRLYQARETANAALVDAPALSALVGGDLNAQATSAAHQAFGQWGYLDQSASLDPDRIDHVFVHRATPWRASEAALVFATSATAVSDHPGVLVRLAPHAAEAPLVTQLDIDADVDFGHFLAVRGDASPLSWDSGWPARSLGPDAWRLVCTELTGPFAYKSLRDDATWQLGADEAGAAGQTNVSTPLFP